MAELGYSRTNESIAAVILGLNLKPTDEVYSVGGSGDLPFAMLEYVKKVVAVDSNPKQIELIKKRLEFLLDRDIEGFLKVTEKGVADDNLYFSRYSQFGSYNLARRNTYFRSFGVENMRIRFDKIADNTERLKVRRGDFFERLDSISPVSKMYLSNIETTNTDMTLPEVIGKLKAKLKPNGLIYCSKGLNPFYTFFLNKPEDESLLNQSIKIDERLTQFARIIEANTFVPKNDISNRQIWTPVVFRLK